MATVVEPTVREDAVEDALATLDADYHHIFGPDMARWSKGVRGELIEMSRTCQAVAFEAQPPYPRKASASRRRRHRTQLRYRVSRIAPGAVTVLLAPVWTDTTGTSVRHFVARALTGDGSVLKFQPGGSRQITALMQGAYPDANWDHPQTWTAATGQLTDRISRAVAGW